jgi:hypothetical protein
VIKPDKKQEEQTSFEVEAIINDRLDKNSKFEYLVKWKNYDDSYNDWVPVKNFDTMETIREYWKRKNSNPNQIKNIYKAAEDKMNSLKNPNQGRNNNNYQNYNGKRKAVEQRRNSNRYPKRARR